MKSRIVYIVPIKMTGFWRIFSQYTHTIYIILYLSHGTVALLSGKRMPPRRTSNDFLAFSWSVFCQCKVLQTVYHLRDANVSWLFAISEQLY